ncbi:MAG: STAS domain-containing protein [Archangiaceae bacterium]|nr:STAS domain-containing protein [Archangiaceae bacterium]
MTQLAAGRVLVGTPEGHVLIRVEGRGTHMNSQPLRDFVMEMVRRGYHEFDLDLADCLYVDSTFAGVIVALSLQVRENTGGKVSVFGANSRCREQLHTLGVDHLFDLDHDDERAPGISKAEHVEALPWPYRSQEAWSETILEAHKTLAAVDPTNAERLQDVIEYMQQQRAQRLH